VSLGISLHFPPVLQTLNVLPLSLRDHIVGGMPHIPSIS
jgi:hypothetical protein